MKRLHADETTLTQTLFVRLGQPHLGALAELANTLGQSREETARQLIITALSRKAAQRKPPAREAASNG